MQNAVCGFVVCFFSKASFVSLAWAGWLKSHPVCVGSPSFSALFHATSHTKASPSELGSPKAILCAHGISGSCFSEALGRRHDITAGSWGASSLALPRMKSQQGGPDAGTVSIRAALCHTLRVPGA